MADIRLKKKNPLGQQNVEIDPEQAQSLLQQAGAGAMSGLHVLGSLGSLPSRALWGGLNAATGGDVGNLDPYDSKGGVELDRFLSNKGVIAPNDESLWEITPTFENGKFNPGDLGRGVIAALGDPTTYIAPFGLTKAGASAYKAGKLAGTTAEQLARGDRALLSFHAPFGESLGHAGTGAAVAKGLEATGIPKLAKKASKTAAALHLRGMFDWTRGGKVHPVVQPKMPGYFKSMEEADRGLSKIVLRHARKLEQTGHNTDEANEMLRNTLEGLPGHDPFGFKDEITQHLNNIREQDLHLGTGLPTSLQDVIEYFPRYFTHGAEGMTGGSSRVLSGKGSVDKARQLVYQGFNGGTSAINRMFRETTNGIRNNLYNVLDKAGHLPHGERAKEISNAIRTYQRNLPEDHIDKIAETYFTPKGQAQLHKATNSLEKVKAAHSKTTESFSKMGSMTKPEIIQDYAARHNERLANLQAKDIDGLYREHLGKIDKMEAKNNLTDSQLKRLDKLRGMTEDQVIQNHQTQLARMNLSPEELASRAVSSHPKRMATAEGRIKTLNDIEIPIAESRLNDVQKLAKNRYDRLAKKFVSASDLKAVREKGLFGNSVYADMLTHGQAANRRHAGAGVVLDALNEVPHDEAGVSIRKALGSLGYHGKKTEEGLEGAWKHVDLDKKVPQDLVDALQELSPRYTAPPAEKGLSKAVKTAMAWWKGLTLAMPSSRARDFVGGVVRNVLNKHVDPRFLVQDTNSLLSGKIIHRDYSHVPEVQEWLKASKVGWSPENQTEALRQIVGTHLPSESNMMADVIAGKSGASLEHVLHNVPGQREQSLISQGIIEPAKTLIGRGAKSESGEVPSWFGRSGVKGIAPQQTRVRGVGDNTETLLAPVKASEQVSAAADQINRTGPFLEMLHNGWSPEVAARRVNQSQVDYNPSHYTPAERWIKSYLYPFYSFESRMLGDTAKELTDLGGPTSQLVKGFDRAHGGGNPKIPDYIMQGTALPLGETEDGGARFLTGAGLMHEPAVSTLGLAAGGHLRPMAYDALARLAPYLSVPLQRATGQSFFQRGEPVESLDPTIPRVLSNTGETLGLLPENSRPIDFKGSRILDAIIGATPYSRNFNTARTLLDPRKDVGTKLADTFSGLKITDVSAKKQISTLRKRATELAKDLGAFEVSEAIFPNLEELAATNPRLAEEQFKLQGLIRSLRSRSKEKPKELRLKKRD